MSKFRVIFEVRFEDGTVAVEKNETEVEISIHELKQESPSEGIGRFLKSGEHTIRALQAIPDRDFPYEAAQGAGAIIARFVTLQLRNWARSRQ